MGKVYAKVKTVTEIESPLLTKNEAARYLRISIGGLDRLMAEKSIQYIKVRQLVFFTRKGLDDFLISRTIYSNNTVNPSTAQTRIYIS